MLPGCVDTCNAYHPLTNAFATGKIFIEILKPVNLREDAHVAISQQREAASATQLTGQLSSLSLMWQERTPGTPVPSRFIAQEPSCEHLATDNSLEV